MSTLSLSGTVSLVLSSFLPRFFSLHATSMHEQGAVQTHGLCIAFYELFPKLTLGHCHIFLAQEGRSMPELKERR